MLVTVLGHRGMLGNAVYKYFADNIGWEISTLNERFPSKQFKKFLLNSKSDFIVNCIGGIPQKKLSYEEYVLLNEDLPKFLDIIGKPIIHPSTDCEFGGDLPLGASYAKSHLRDASDTYGQSKARISDWIKNEAIHTKIIRTSIIGHELNTAYSLLDWFLSQESAIRGYTDHYWNGITTLEWAKQCHILMDDWSNAPKLTQLGTEPCISKYELLCLVRDVYAQDIEITPYATGHHNNKCLITDRMLPSLTDQLLELKIFNSK